MKKKGLPVKLEWFKHLPINNEKDEPMNFQECVNYPNVEDEPKNCIHLERIHLQVRSHKKL